MLSLVDACLSRLPGRAASPCRPLLRLIGPTRTHGVQIFSCRQQFLQSPAAAAAATARSTHAHALPGAAEDFFAPSTVTFGSLGLAAEVCGALRHAGYPRPAHSQELATPAILAGQDVVLAAETGSGKTLAYLAPLISLALHSRQAEPAAGEAGVAEVEEVEAAALQRRWRPTAALVLCPNAVLCEQVVAAAQVLRDPASGAPLAAAAFVSAQFPPPLRLPDIVVSTPGALVSLLDNGGPTYGFEWTRAGLPTWAARVVFDESDLLLSGGYGAQMRIIWDVLRAGDRTHAARRICLQVGLSEDEFAELPRHLKQAAQRGGAQGLLDAGFKPSGAVHDGCAGLADGRLQQEQGEEEQQAEEGGGARGVRGPSWRRQYMFVAATMPAEGERSVGAELAARFPEAAWLSGRQLHQSKRALAHSWRRVEGEAHRTEVLHEVVAGDEQLAAGGGRMLVFARDVASARATAAALKGGGGGGSSIAEEWDSHSHSRSSSGGGSCGGNGSSSTSGRVAVPVLQYHKGLSVAERAAALAQLSSQQGLVMVCTDAAARGLDVPDVTHVVQADFAHSAIDFLHRVGRTARAGKGGRVTSLYTPDCEPLVQAIRDNITAGAPVEGAFSRKRSFRKKFRKYGEFVPRGQEGPQAPREQRKAELAARAVERRRHLW